MHPQVATHLDVAYDLRHLWQRFNQFTWRDDYGLDMGFSVRVRYSDHCYSDKNLPALPGCYRVGRRGRIFCPIRYAHSLNLPPIIEGLFEKPTTEVRLTYENNLSIFRVEMSPPLLPRHKYFVFFHVDVGEPLMDRGLYRLDLFVESAYQRDTPVASRSRFPFGKVAERTARGLGF
jgi:hypothetical protein